MADIGTRLKHFTNPIKHCLYINTYIQTDTYELFFDNPKNIPEIKTFGQLVVLGFGVTAFTPAPYRRHRL